MANENLNLVKTTTEDVMETFDFDDLEAQLDNQLEAELGDLELLTQEKEKIGNPDNLGKVVMDVVWEQFINQVAVTAGTDFIKENKGLTLDLRNDAHIQTPENFAAGKIAKHNHISKDQLEHNYDRFKNTSHKDFRKKHVNPGMDATLERAGNLKKKGIDTVKDIYTGRDIPTETKLANGKNNPKAAQREHVKSSAEIYANASLQMAKNDKELAATTNHPDNLQGYTTAERNNRKSDKSSEEMHNKDKNKHWKKADEKAENYIKQEEQKGQERLKKEGRQTQKEEAFRAGGAALRAAVMQLLADLMREIIAKLVKWFKSAKKSVDTLIDSLKEAIHTFIGNLKTHVINAGNSVITAIATAIIGPIVGTIKKVWTLLKQGWRSFKDAVNYLKDPANKGKPIDLLLVEVGKIIIVGLTGIGAIALGEAIEKGLMAIPIFAVEIPLLGSLGNILGIFLGAIVAGIIGAIALNRIDKSIAKKKKTEVQSSVIDKSNDILILQAKQGIVADAKLEKQTDDFFSRMQDRHEKADKVMLDSLTNIMEDFVRDPSEYKKDEIILDAKDIERNKKLEEIDDELDKLLDSL